MTRGQPSIQREIQLVTWSAIHLYPTRPHSSCWKPHTDYVVIGYFITLLHCSKHNVRAGGFDENIQWWHRIEVTANEYNTTSWMCSFWLWRLHQPVLLSLWMRPQFRCEYAYRDVESIWGWSRPHRSPNIREVILNGGCVAAATTTTSSWEGKDSHQRLDWEYSLIDYLSPKSEMFIRKFALKLHQETVAVRREDLAWQFSD